jgi:hypothetical protein
MSLNVSMFRLENEGLDAFFLMRITPPFVLVLQMSVDEVRKNNNFSSCEPRMQPLLIILTPQQVATARWIKHLVFAPNPIPFPVVE